MFLLHLYYSLTLQKEIHIFLNEEEEEKEKESNRDMYMAFAKLLLNNTIILIKIELNHLDIMTQNIFYLNCVFSCRE